MRATFSALPLVFLLCFTMRAESPAPQACAGALTAARKAELVDYLRKKLDLAAELSLELMSDQAVSGSCYRQLTFQGKGPLKSWKLKYYLSPDQRYLTSELLDSASDPAEERRRRDEALMSDLSHQSGASQGPADAPVTLVEFSDFQCPFCRNFSVVLKEVLAIDRDRIRVVFHHMPLSMHAWARTAAEGAACAQLQNSASFWSIHDKLFEAQRDMTASNVREKLLEFAHEARTLDTAAFQTCLDNQLSLGLVFQDLDLASTAQVSGTPTVFLNGRRLTGIKDAAALHAAVVQASTPKAVAQAVAGP